MDVLPRLRDTQWTLLERLVAIDSRRVSVNDPRTIQVAFVHGGAVIVGVADSTIVPGDLVALRDVGALNVQTWVSSMTSFTVSQRGIDLCERHARAAGEPTAEEILTTYRERRQWLAGRVARFVGRLVIVAGVVVVVVSALTSSQALAVIGVVTAVFGGVTEFADRVRSWLADRIDRWLLSVFESR